MAFYFDRKSTFIQFFRSKGMELLSTFHEVNYFNVLAAKGCTPTAIITQQNVDDQIPQEILNATLAIHEGLVKAFSDSNNPDTKSPGKILSLKNLGMVFNRYIDHYFPQSCGYFNFKV